MCFYFCVFYNANNDKIVQLFNLCMNTYTYIGDKLLLMKHMKKLQTFLLEDLRIFAVKQHLFELISP